MDLKDWYKIIFVPKKNSAIGLFLKLFLLNLVIPYSLISSRLYGMCPTVCKNLGDFCYVDKRLNAPPIIVDSFVDDEGAFGITANGMTPGGPDIVLKPEEELEQILAQNPDQLKEMNVAQLLADLQKEGDIYLGEDFGIGPRITLDEAIFLSLKDNEGVGFGDTSVNQGITTAYLDREKQKESLKVVENTFLLNWDMTLPLTFIRSHFRDGPHVTNVTIPTPSINATQKLKTGDTAGITLGWTNPYTYNKVNGQPSNTTATTVLGISLTQPLLRGAGFFFGTLPLTNAYLTEERNVNSLKNTVIDVVTQTIGSYYEYKQAIDQFNIDKRSIEEARQDLDKTKLLVEAGTRAEADIVEGQYNLATREISFQDSRNRVDQARIAFLRVLNMDTSLNIVPSDLIVPEIDPKDLPPVEELVATAYLNSPNYLNQLISFRESEISYIVARNNTLWDLTLNTGIASTSPVRSSLGRSNQNAWDFRDRVFTAGLTLVVPINKLDKEAGLINAKIDLRIAKISLQKFEQDLTRDIKNKLRDIKKDILQLKLTRINVLLAKQRLLQKRVEIEAGLSSSFELTSILDQYISAEQQELGAKITLMNDLAAMDALLGTTLDTWHIDINRRTDNLPKLSDTLFGKIKVTDIETKTGPKANAKTKVDDNVNGNDQLAVDAPCFMVNKCVVDDKCIIAEKTNIVEKAKVDNKVKPDEKVKVDDKVKPNEKVQLDGLIASKRKEKKTPN